MKKQRGITLIALVITIIVMMILVGVTVAVVLNGGLFKTADEATTKTEKEVIYDQIIGTMKLDNNGKINVSETYEAVENNFSDKVSETKWNEDNAEVIFKITGKRGTYTYKITGETIKIEPENAGGGAPTLTGDYLLDSNYTLAVGEKTITIPEGFGVVDTSEGEEELEVLIDDITKYPTYITEENIEKGIVIQDGVGNEFVWIPVPKINDMVMCQSAEKNVKCTLTLEGNTLKCTKHNSEALAGKLYADETKTSFGTNFNANFSGQTYNATSGYREPANLTAKTTLSETDVGETGVAPGEYEYDSDQMFRVYAGTQEGYYYENMYQDDFDKMATSVAINGGFYIGRYETGGFNKDRVVTMPDRGMKENGDTDNTTWYKMYVMQKDFGNDIVGSSMIWGCQHDQVLKFVNGKKDGEGVTFDVTKNSTSRHSQSVKAGTGNTSADFVANIYDLEGNKFDFSLEAYNIENRIPRGGHCMNRDVASYRMQQGPKISNTLYGSRLTLYIQ